MPYVTLSLLTKKPAEELTRAGLMGTLSAN